MQMKNGSRWPHGHVFLATGLMIASCIFAADAEVRPQDSWGFDIEAGKSPEEQEFVSRQNPQRSLQELNFGFVPGVPGVSREGLWCGIGAEARISSAMILPAQGDFTLSFYIGFPEPLKGRFEITRNPKMSVFFTQDGKFAVSLLDTTVSGNVSVADGRWHHFAVIRKGDELSLWTDGAKVAAKAKVRETVYDHIRGVEAQWKLFSKDNRSRLFLDELAIYFTALGPDELRRFAAFAAAAKAPCVSPEDEVAICDRRRSADPPLAGEEEYVPLTIRKGDLRTFAEQHDVFALAVPWFDPAGRDLICEGTIFGSRPLLYRFLRMERGVPVYAEGVPYTGISPRGTSPWYGKDGAFGICRVEMRRLGDGKQRAELVRYRFDLAAHDFVDGETVLGEDGKPYRLPGGRMTFADIDGDGVDDLLTDHRNVERGGTTNCNDGFPWPKKGNSPWTDEETP